MCTVIFKPENNKIFLASLRDESPKRARALAPDVRAFRNVRVLAPVDGLAGGTWIATNDRQDVVILLNGGFENHVRAISYRKSRGLIVQELIQSEMPIVDWGLMDLSGIEPFTLIMWSAGMLFQMVWDGKSKHRLKLDATMPQIWSSSTLYAAEAKEKRKNQFQQWLAMEPTFSKSSLLDFFKTSMDRKNGFIINRNEIVRTISYSFLELEAQQTRLDYYDFTNYSISYRKLEVARQTSEGLGCCTLP